MENLIKRSAQMGIILFILFGSWAFLPNTSCACTSTLAPNYTMYSSINLPGYGTYPMNTSAYGGYPVSNTGYGYSNYNMGYDTSTNFYIPNPMAFTNQYINPPLATGIGVPYQNFSSTMMPYSSSSNSATLPCQTGQLATPYQTYSSNTNMMAPTQSYGSYSTPSRWNSTGAR